MQDEVTLRPMEPGDGPAIAALGEQTPDTGAAAFYSQFNYDPYETLLALHPGTIGVVAEAAGREGLVGMGLVSFGECWFEERVLASAYLGSLSVHPDFRRRGIAGRLADWRVAAARERYGEDVVIFAGIQSGNTGSIKTAERWSAQRLDARSQLGVAKVRTRPPRPISGVEVRAARAGELEQIAAKQNSFYAGWNLYPPETAGHLDTWRTQQAFGQPLNEYYVAVDGGGNVLAGLGVSEAGRLITDHVLRLPLPLRIANAVLKLLPPDGVVRRLQVRQFWFAPGQVEAGRYLWESLRWLLRERGTVLMTFFDPRSPLAQAVVLPRFMPVQTGSVVLRGPVQAREDRLLYWTT